MSRVAEPRQQPLAQLTSASEKTNTDMNDNRVRLEGRLDWNIENQDAVVAKIRADLAKVEAEIWRTPINPGRDFEEPLLHGISPCCADDWESAHLNSFVGGGGPRDDEESDKVRRGDFTFENGGTDGPRWRFKKLDLPTFDRKNPDRWIMRAERFFKFY